jgi:protein involved in polysaccharide export with SLBB domain
METLLYHIAVKQKQTLGTMSYHIGHRLGGPSRGSRAGMRIILAAALVLSLATGCTLRERKHLEPETKLPQVVSESATSAARATLDASGSVVPTDAYRLTPGDQILVHFPDLTNQDFQALVRPDGYITSPRYGDQPAMGWTPAQLADSLGAVYGREFLSPRATVQVTAFGPQYFYVFGEIRRPDRYELDAPLELISAITRAGGFLRSAVLTNVILVKVGADGAYTFSMHNLNDIAENPSPPVWLEPNDIVIVPQSALSNAAEFIRDYVMTFMAPADAFLRGRYYWRLAQNNTP